MTTATPTRPEELEELLSDPARARELVDQGKLGDVVAEYARSIHAKDQNLTAQIKDETTKALAALLEVDRKDAAKLNLAPATSTPSAKGAAYNKRAIGTAVDSLYEDSAEFVQTAWQGNASLPHGEALRTKASEARRIQNTFSSLTGGDGAFLVPETLRSELLQVSLETAVVRSRARVLPMSSQRLPIPTVDDTSHASSVFGGLVAYWTEEAATLTSVSATFGRVVLDAKKLTGYAGIPNELMADAPALGGFFDSAFPAALSYFEDAAFLVGTGSGEPLGVLNSKNPAIVAVTKETGQAANTIVWENITKMYARMLPTSLSRAVWIANIETFPQLSTMALSVGTGGAPVWLANGIEGPPMTLLGRPIIFTEKAPALSSQGDISFVDLQYYLIGDRQVLQAASSSEYLFGSDQIAFRLISRVDGRPWLPSAITPRLGSATLSPYVQLGSR